MIVLVLIGILILASLNMNKFIKSNFTILAIVSSIISVISYLYLDVSNIINTGFVGLAFLTIVMFTTAFKKGSNLYKKNLLLRKEYSILGIIFIIPHCITFILGEYQAWEWNGIISFIIMIPLFITSFIIIRKKMNNQTWIKFHLLAYPSYLLMFTHLIIVGEEHRVIYIILLLIYIFMKFKNDKFMKIKKYNLIFTSLSIIALVVFLNINDIVNELVIANSNINDNNYENGIYYGEATGYKSYDVKVNVEMLDNEIKNIEIIDCGCTNPAKGINFEESVNKVKDEIIENQSLDVDTISGATKSTTGLIKSIDEALNKSLISEK